MCLYQHRLVYCLINDIAGPDGIYYGFLIGMILNLGTFFVYTSIWLLLFKFKGKFI
jgi:hypothetical protein